MNQFESDSQLNRGDEFVRLFSRHEARVHAYILSLVPNWSDAADILQETSSVMWRKFGEFELGTNFFAWACQIARLEVLSFRKRQRHDLVLFSDAFVESVASKASAMSELLETRQAHLASCMQKLRETDRDMLRQRYFDDCSIDVTAERTQRSVEAVYKAIQRIRKQLFECIERAMMHGGHS